MKLSMSYFYGNQQDKISMARQLGVEHAVINASTKGDVVPDDGRWNFESFYAKVQQFREAGLTVSVVEGPTPLDMTKLGLPGRDREIAVFCDLLRHMGRLGIPTVCYNWMPIIGWFRSMTDIPARGGATVTGYRHSMMRDAGETEYGQVPAERLWENLEYFLQAVLPVAEEAGVNLAVHPDDPPVGAIRGIARILTSFDALKRLIDLAPSKANGITLCQGCFATMGEDVQEVIRYFMERERIFFAHFRDIRGSAEDFVETFHDDGQTDMYRCMRLYQQYGFNGCIRPDHVPAMAGEANDHPGYSMMGNLFAIGYMKGLMEAAACETAHNRGKEY